MKFSGRSRHCQCQNLFHYPNLLGIFFHPRQGQKSKDPKEVHPIYLHRQIHLCVPHLGEMLNPDFLYFPILHLLIHHLGLHQNFLRPDFLLLHQGRDFLLRFQSHFLRLHFPRLHFLLRLRRD